MELSLKCARENGISGNQRKSGIELRFYIEIQSQGDGSNLL
jgi:hypothetical protein